MAQDSLPSQVSEALKLAVNYTFNRAKPDGHWVGECRSNAAYTAEWIFLRLCLGLDISLDSEAWCRWILSEQNSDGSWGLGPDYPGDVSTTTEAYLALKILSLSPAVPAMRRARDFMVAAGGISKVRVFTRLYLTTFGLMPWDAVPQLPTEFILMPPQSPVNIYTMASWARSTVIPLLIVRHHEPIFALPNGESADKNFLDELWVDKNYKMVPYAPPLWGLWKTNRVEFTLTVVDKVLYYLGALRRYARHRCVQWLLEHQEDSGDWAGFTLPLQGSILALFLEGFKVEDSPVRRGIEAMERFSLQDEKGRRTQVTVSPVWDTGLMAVALSDAGVPPNDERLRRGI